MSNPFLVGGVKFSMGVFVAFSSANPLRAYIWGGARSYRFCSKPYYPMNISDPATYVTDGVEIGGGNSLLTVSTLIILIMLIRMISSLFAKLQKYFYITC